MGHPRRGQNLERGGAVSARPASASELSCGEALNSDSALGTARKQVKPSGRQRMHQDFKGAALCLSNPTFRNLTKRELYTTVTKQTQGSVLSFYAGTTSRYGTVESGTIHRKDPVSRP